MAKKNRRNKPAPAPQASKDSVPTTTQQAGAGKPHPHPSARGGRETIDALVIAVVLAFFIRTFQAEAFVIPTGSMAPTLMGAHKDVYCDECGQRFRVNASDEVGEQVEYYRQMRHTRELREQDAENLLHTVRSGRVSQQGLNFLEGAIRKLVEGGEVDDPQAFFQKIRAGQLTSTQYDDLIDALQWRLGRSQYAQRIKDSEVAAGCCPQCRYIMPLAADEIEAELPEGVDKPSGHPPYAGDRLVVSKLSYMMADPKRWEVIVFKYPGNATTNYIKRLVGLPNEALRVFQGDVFTKDRSDEGAEYTIARKPHKTVMAMRQLVHDTDHEPTKLVGAGWPLRWSGDEAWGVEVDERGKNSPQVYQGAGEGDSLHWLRYRHLLPTEAVWRKALADPNAQFDQTPAPGLITDYNAYNSQLLHGEVRHAGEFTLRPVLGSSREYNRLGVHWAGDLMLEADVDIQTSEGKLHLELVEAGDHYRCSIDLATGEARLAVFPFEGAASEGEEIATATTPIRGPGLHEVWLSNFDDQLLLWVDGSPIELDGRYELGATVDERRGRIPKTSSTDPGDLAPAGVAVEGAKVAITGLRLYRDIYYVADHWERQRDGVFVCDLDLEQLTETSGADWRTAITDLPTRPEWWGSLAERRHVDFETLDGQYFMMGDNSTSSLDSRLWYGGNGRDKGRPGGSYLEESQLVGKAICVYWPHSWYTAQLPFTSLRVPFWPNFADMRHVR